MTINELQDLLEPRNLEALYDTDGWWTIGRNLISDKHPSWSGYETDIMGQGQTIEVALRNAGYLIGGP